MWLRVTSRKFQSNELLYKAEQSLLMIYVNFDSI
jgi:hypothetical protein